MPGKNACAGCDRLRESSLTASTLAVTGSIEGTLSRTTYDVLTDKTNVYIETLTFLGGITLHREPFDVYRFYAENAFPEEGKIWIGQPCCCKCQWSIKGHGGTEDSFGFGEFVEASWENRETGGGDDEVVTTGTIPTSVTLGFNWADNVITQPGSWGEGRKPCRNASEGNLQGIHLGMEFDGLTLLPALEMAPERVLTPSGMSLLQEDFGDRFLINVGYGYAKCSGLNVGLIQTFVGSATSEDTFGNTIEEEVDVTMTVGLLLA